MQVRDELRLDSVCSLVGEVGAHCVSIGLLCPKMRRYGTTVEVRGEVRLDSLCTVDGEGGAHCMRK